MGGSRLRAASLPFANRDARWDALLLTGWDDPSEDAKQVSWSRHVQDPWRPFCKDASYTDALSDEDTESDVRSSYGSAFARLSRLKARCDPANLFRMDANIKPAAVYSSCRSIEP